MENDDIEPGKKLTKILINLGANTQISSSGEEAKYKEREEADSLISNLNREEYINDLRKRLPIGDIPILVSFFSFINDDWIVNSDSYNVYSKLMPSVYKEQARGLDLKNQFILYLEEKNTTSERIPFHILSLIVYKMSEDKNIKSFDFEEELTRMYRNKNEVIKIYPELTRLIDKIINHCELSVLQADFINKNMKSIQEQSVEVKKNLDKLSETKDKIYSEFIAILGIFSALMFGLFGSFQGLSISISKMVNDYNLGKTIIATASIFIAISVFTYSLINWIGHLIDKPINSCGCKKNSNCTHNFYKRNKSFIIILLIELILFLIGMVIFSSKITGITSNIKNIGNGWLLTGSILGFTVLAFVSLLILIFKKSKSF